jgi:hypothetical protein
MLSQSRQRQHQESYDTPSLHHPAAKVQKFFGKDEEYFGKIINFARKSEIENL